MNRKTRDLIKDHMKTIPDDGTLAPLGHAERRFGQFADGSVAGADAGERQHGYVIVLTEGHRFRGGLLGTGLAAKEDGEPVETIKLA